MTITVEEKSLQLALVKAAGKLRVTQSDLEFKILSQSDGFLGFFGKKVCIEVWKKKTTSYLFPLNNQSTEIQSSSQIKEELHVFCIRLCKKMFGEKIRVTAQLDQQRLILDIHSKFLADQILKNPKIHEAFEHLLRKKMRQISPEPAFRIFVDAQHVRIKKEENLIDMANDLSNKVYENQKPIVLNYQSPYDRKIIHMALDKDQRVYTKSIGVGQNRKLMILPAKQAHG